MARWNLYKWVLLTHLMMAVNAEGNCSDGAVRLVDGQSQFEGRVEVCLSGTWGTVCDSGVWGTQDAEVVCSQLTATDSGDGVPMDGDYFGNGTGPISLMSVYCMGSEDKIIECLEQPGKTCDHDKDVGVFCSDPADSCMPGEVRMMDNTSTFEICYRGVWGPVCADANWNDTGANTICCALNLVDQPVGFAVAEANSILGSARGSAIFQIKSCNPELWQSNGIVHCFGPPVDPNCQNYAGVLCLDSDHCDEGSIRLTNSSTTPDEGVVEICYRGVWGALCGDGWSPNEAKVLCRQLGYIHGYTGSNAGYSVQFEVLIISSCNRMEPNRFSCFHGELQAQICHSGTHAQVFCTNTTSSVLMSSAVPSTAYSGYVTTTLEYNLNLSIMSTPQVFSRGPVSTVVTPAPKASNVGVIVTGVLVAVSVITGTVIGIGITVPILVLVIKRRTKREYPLRSNNRLQNPIYGHSETVRQVDVNMPSNPIETHGDDTERTVINDLYSTVAGDGTNSSQHIQPRQTYEMEGVSGKVVEKASYHHYELVADPIDTDSKYSTIQLDPAVVYETLTPCTGTPSRSKSIGSFGGSACDYETPKSTHGGPSELASSDLYSRLDH